MPAKPSTTPSFCVSVWNEDTHFAFNMTNLHFSTLNSIILIQMDNLFEYKLMPFNMLKHTHTKKPSLNIYLYSVCVILHAEWKYQIKYNAQLVYWNVCFLLLFFLFLFRLLGFRSSRLDNHLILCHNYKKDEFRCDTCSQAFSYRPSLLRHKALQHGEVRRFPCENCSKVSSFFLYFFSQYLHTQDIRVLNFPLDFCYQIIQMLWISQ